MLRIVLYFYIRYFRFEIFELLIDLRSYDLVQTFLTYVHERLEQLCECCEKFVVHGIERFDFIEFFSVDIDDMVSN